MKLNGTNIAIREVVDVVLARKGVAPITLRVTGFPVGIQRAYEVVNPRPTPPTKSTGISTVRGGEKVEKNYDDPNYLAAFDEWLHLQKFFYLYHCLGVTEGLVFENSADTVVGLRAIAKEFEHAGFSEGDIGQLMSAINAATHIESSEIAEAKKTF